VSRRALVLLLTVAAAAVGVLSAGAAVSPPWIPDATVSDVLTLSAWGRANGVAEATCSGTGAARQSAGRAEHGGFRCVIQGTKPGIVLAKALGPQWLKVTKIVQGTAKPDRGIGAVPKAKPVLAAFWAGGVVEDTDWMTSRGLDSAFCYGVGPAEDQGASQYLFGAYSCATFSMSVRGPQILVVADSEDRVHIVRQLAP
jgi:hypothetical protein